MSAITNKVDFLSSELNVSKENIVFLNVTNASEPIPAPKMFNEYFGILEKEEISLYKIHSKGLFKKTYSLENVELKLDINKFQTAEFGRGSGTLWLQTKYNDKDLIFTSNWKLEGTMKFIKVLETKIKIIDRKLLK